MTYQTSTPDPGADRFEPWAAPSSWGEWVRQPRVAKELDISVDLLTRQPGIRQRKVSHKTVLLNRDDVVAWINSGIRSRYIAPAPPVAPAKPPHLHRRFGAVVPAAEEVAG